MEKMLGGVIKTFCLPYSTTLTLSPEGTYDGKEQGSSFSIEIDKVHIKEIISMSPDFCIFPYVDKC